MNVTFRQLRVFVEVARHLSFVRAAEALFLTQPALSRSIRALEDELGQPLFDRIGRRSELTPFGRDAVERARELVLAADDLRDSARLAGDGHEGVLRIGMGSGPGAMLMTPLLLQVARERPGLTVEANLIIQERAQALRSQACQQRQHRAALGFGQNGHRVAFFQRAAAQHRLEGVEPGRFDDFLQHESPFTNPALPKWALRFVRIGIIIHEISCNWQSMMSPPRKAAPPVFSPREFRASLGMFATGVTIVTARTAEGERVGLTANSFNSVSLDPPLVLWSLARAAGSLPAFSAGSHYAINILAADQKALAERFAARGADRWTGVAFTEGAGRAPLLAGAAATFECFNRSRYEEGDHVIFVGEVERCTHRADASPLLFHGGKFYTEHPL